MPVEHSPKGVPAHLPDAQAGGLVPTEDPATPRPTAVDATGGSSEEIPFVDESLTTAFWKMFVNELQGQAGGAASSGAHGPLPEVPSDEKPPAPKKPPMVLQLHYKMDLTKVMKGLPLVYRGDWGERSRLALDDGGVAPNSPHGLSLVPGVANQVVTAIANQFAHDEITCFVKRLSPGLSKKVGALMSQEQIHGTQLTKDQVVLMAIEHNCAFRQSCLVLSIARGLGKRWANTDGNPD
ncbi:hypothetical protein PCASD_24978 [Puccinia coronata f. sp. avenae]|uniref:Uncharacterized protein n=1 Tax=Puccinia coronata f. sp. avenae TaxID=200324 RepID=A0A2N5T1D9_9BASI|nr:hypothetical protein PCASD_24978 [Puccinia coronata f. sp. avenae]